MARPVSWLPRLHEIRRSVASSVRSHYTRRDLEHLFQLQTSAASALLDLLPATGLGTSQLVERDALEEFLDRVQKATDVAALLRELREKRQPSSRRKIRYLVQRDVELPSPDALPTGLTLERGRMEVKFQSLEELAGMMMQIAQWLDSDPERFAQDYEPKAEEPVLTDLVENLSAMFAELERMEALRSTTLARTFQQSVLTTT